MFDDGPFKLVLMIFGFVVLFFVVMGWILNYKSCGSYTVQDYQRGSVPVSCLEKADKYNIPTNE